LLLKDLIYGLFVREAEKYRGKWVAVARHEPEFVSFSGENSNEVVGKIEEDKKHIRDYTLFYIMRR
jgi:hypothetical protein